MSPDDTDEDDAEAAFERAVRESAAARSGETLVEIWELSPNSATVVVEQESESAPSLYRVERAPGIADGEGLRWSYLGEVDG